MFLGELFQTQTLRISILQKSAFRIVCRLGGRDSYKNAFETLKSLTLPSLYTYETIVYCFSTVLQFKVEKFIPMKLVLKILFV